MKQKHYQNIYHLNVNVNLMVENIIQIQIRIVINVDVSANIQKSIMWLKRIMYGIPVYVLVKMVNI